MDLYCRVFSSSSNNRLTQDDYILGSPRFAEKYPDNVIPTNPFMSVEWIKIFESSKKYQALHFTVWSGDKCLLLQPLFICRFKPFLPDALGSYCVALYAPWIVDDNDNFDKNILFSFLLNSLQNYLRHKILYIEFRHFSIDNIFHSCFTNCGFKSLNWCDVICNLKNCAFENDIIKTKRKQIKRTLNSGAYVDFAPTKRVLDCYYNFQHRLYSKIFRPLPELSVFNSLISSSIGSVAVIRNEDDVYGGCSYFIFDNILYFWYIASAKEVPNDVYPDAVLYYSLMKKAADEGCIKADFMGGGNADRDYGVRNFKLSLGGEMVAEYRYKKYLCL